MAAYAEYASSGRCSVGPAAIDVGHGPGPLQVTGIQLADMKTTGADQRGYVAVQVAAAGFRTTSVAGEARAGRPAKGRAMLHLR